MILVIGATGTIGAHVVRELERRGAPVTAFTRDPGRARERLGDGVAIAAGDLGDADSVRSALAGAEVLVLANGDDPRRVAWETAAIDAAAAAGVRRVVRLSTVGAARGAAPVAWDRHGRLDEHLRAAPVPAVTLRSSFFMSNLLAGAGQVAARGVLAAPAGRARIAMIDPRDVGAALAAAATGAAEDGTTHVLTGPDAITHDEAAARLAVATGRDVTYVAMGDDAAREGLGAAGLPPAAAEGIVAIFRELRAGAAAQVTDAVRALAGRPPRTFRAFAAEHAAAFAPARVPSAT